MGRPGWSAPEIADALEATGDWVPGVIHEFNGVGLEALVPAWGGDLHLMRGPNLVPHRYDRAGSSGRRA